MSLPPGIAALPVTPHITTILILDLDLDLDLDLFPYRRMYLDGSSQSMSVIGQMRARTTVLTRILNGTGRTRYFQDISAG